MAAAAGGGGPTLGPSPGPSLGPSLGPTASLEGAGPGLPPKSASTPAISADALPPKTASVPALAAGSAAASAVGVVGAGGVAGSTLTKKIQKALALRVDSTQSRDALKSLSGFFSENTVHTRRNLRPTIEGQGLILHQEFVSAFEGLEAQIEGLEKFVNTLDSACSRAQGELQRSRTETAVSLERAAQLQRESKAIDEKQEVLEKFLMKFRICDSDTQLLRSGDRPIDDEFFAAFEKLEKVRGNARHMLNACGQQTSGVDILHETSEIMEACYERMFVWVRQQCHSPQLAAVTRGGPHELDSPAGAVLKRALLLLVERPVYFNHCVKDIAKMRRQALMQRFFEALSQGDGAGSRPIELQAYDPVRYVGDMLAWIHQNVASEREAIATLLGSKRSEAAMQSSQTQAPASDGLTLATFEEVLDQTLEGLVHPFSSRVVQVLETQAQIVVAYKVAQVLSFFAKTLEEVLHRPDCCLVVMCRDMHVRTQQSFLDMWEAHSQKLRQNVGGVYVSELSAPAFVMEAVNTLKEILAIYESALVPTEEREMDFLPILSAAFDPLLNHCQQVAAMMDPAEAQVFLANCVAAMQEPLRKHDFTAERVAMYAALLDDQVQLLVDGQAAAVLAKLGLAERLKALREKAPETPLSAVPELHPVSLSATLRSFYNSLFTLGGALALPLLDRIVSRSLRSEARSGVTRLIAQAYEELYLGIQELGVATHTPEQVRTLLE